MFFTQNITEQIAKLKVKKKPEEIRHILNNKLIAKNYPTYRKTRNVIFRKIEQRRKEM
jgi:ethanolamine utilization cobalamin adenosyltransferase